jgi:hypothetical protein
VLLTRAALPAVVPPAAARAMQWVGEGRSTQETTLA